VFVFGSFIYLSICFFEARYKLKKTKKGYYALKNNYKDIFSEVELNDAFDNDKLLKDTDKSAKKGMIGWTIAWGILLTVAIIIIESFTTNHGLIVWIWSKFFC
jgi:hypothetical protein